MLSKLLQSFQAASNPFQGYLGELWTIWTVNAARAVLLARWFWQKLPAELVQQAAAIQQQAQAAQAQGQINQIVNMKLGALGIFHGGAGAGTPIGFGMNSDHAMFILVMGTIRAHQGDAPSAPGMAQLAEAVLRGQMDPVDAMIATLPPLLQQQMIAAVQMAKMGGMYQFLRLQAIVGTAFSLPRPRIPVILPEDHLEPPTAAPVVSGGGEQSTGAVNPTNDLEKDVLDNTLSGFKKGIDNKLLADYVYTVPVDAYIRSNAEEPTIRILFSQGENRERSLYVYSSDAMFHTLPFSKQVQQFGEEYYRRTGKILTVRWPLKQILNKCEETDITGLNVNTGCGKFEFYLSIQDAKALLTSVTT